MPIRNDFKIPYDIEDYNNFKKFKKYSNPEFNKIFNFRKYCTKSFVGRKDPTSISKDNEIDFMHFQEPGHKILSETLYSEMTNHWPRG